MGPPHELHRHVRLRIELALSKRSWNWLSQETGVPQSTLASQAGKPKFSLEVLVLVARALDRDIRYFLPPEELGELSLTPAGDALNQVAAVIARVQVGRN